MKVQHAYVGLTLRCCPASPREPFVTLNHSLTCSLLLTYSRTHVLTYARTHLLTYSPTHLLTYSPTHLLTYSPVPITDDADKEEQLQPTEVLEVKEIRSRLQRGCVCELMYADELGVYLALVVSTPAPTAKKVDVFWLHELVNGSNVYVADPWTRGTKRCWIRDVAEPISDTQKLDAAEAETVLKCVEFSQALDEIRTDDNAQLPALIEVGSCEWHLHFGCSHRGCRAQHHARNLARRYRGHQHGCRLWRTGCNDTR